MNREEREARKAEAGKGPGRPYRKGITLLELARMFPDEASAREWFEKQIWPDGERCCVRLRIVQHLSSEAPHDAVSVPGLRLALQREDGDSWRVRREDPRGRSERPRNESGRGPRDPKGGRGSATGLRGQCHRPGRDGVHGRVQRLPAPRQPRVRVPQPWRVRSGATSTRTAWSRCGRS